MHDNQPNKKQDKKRKLTIQAKNARQDRRHTKATLRDLRGMPIAEILRGNGYQM